MNNPSTDLITILLIKFPEFKDIITSNGFKSNFGDDKKSLKTFLFLNSYNEQLSSETDTDLFFKNLNTGQVSIAHITDSETYGSTIEFAPYYRHCNITLNSDYPNEAIAFSICNPHFTCVRLNEMGMFIEEYSKKYLITTEFYDFEAIKNIFNKIDFTYYTLYDYTMIIYTLLEKLKSSVEDLSINMKKNYSLVPDMIIECKAPYDNTYVYFKTNDLTIDCCTASRDGYQFYSRYLNFMKEQRYYNDDKKTSRIRIRRNINNIN